MVFGPGTDLISLLILLVLALVVVVEAISSKMPKTPSFQIGYLDRHWPGA